MLEQDILLSKIDTYILSIIFRTICLSWITALESQDDDPFGFFQTETHDVKSEPSSKGSFPNEVSVKHSNTQQDNNAQQEIKNPTKTEPPQQKDLWFQQQQHVAAAATSPQFQATTLKLFYGQYNGIGRT